jgi:ankyrin repeat protein
MNYDQLQQGIKKNLTNPNPDELWKAIESNTLKKYTLTEVGEAMLQKNEAGNTFYHDAAMHRHLDKIPKELLTKETLLQTDETDHGFTCLHYAAKNAQLDQIPKEILTAENLLKTNIYLDTCLHYACEYGQLDKIPSLPYKTILKLEAHFQKDSSLYKKQILAFLNSRIEHMKLETMRRSLTINHDTDIL